MILTIGRNQDPADFGPQPSNVHIERFVPQTLLPYCDLVVTHVGFNTIQAALGRGLPMVIIPIAADQHLMPNPAPPWRWPHGRNRGAHAGSY